MLQIDAAQVAACLDRRALIDALDDAFRKPHQVPERQHYTIDAAQPGRSGGTLLIMPAWDRGPVQGAGAALGVKVVTVFPDNALRGLPSVCASYLLLDAVTGKARAVIDGGELTLRRTAAASALASRYLSSPGAARLLMLGTGKLAPHLIQSHALVRPIREVRIWGRRPECARQLAESLARPGLSIEATEDLEASTRWADVISSATLAQQPLVLGAWLKPGQHLDLVGAFTPQMREADDQAIARCALYVDTRSGALSESGEIVGAIARGIIDQNAIRAEFAELSAGTFARQDPGAITAFKSVGTAIEDLVAAKLVFAATSTLAARS